MGFEIRGDLKLKDDTRPSRILKYAFGVGTVFMFFYSLATVNVVAVVGMAVTVGFAGFLFVDWAESIQSLVIRAIR